MADLDYRRVFETFGDAVVAAGPNDEILFVNRAAERLLGWLREELIGKPLTIIQPERLRRRKTRPRECPTSSVPPVPS